jgi:hypothetical protein
VQSLRHIRGPRHLPRRGLFARLGSGTGHHSAILRLPRRGTRFTQRLHRGGPNPPRRASYRWTGSASPALPFAKMPSGPGGSCEPIASALPLRALIHERPRSRILGSCARPCTSAYLPRCANAAGLTSPAAPQEEGEEERCVGRCSRGWRWRRCWA